VRAIAPGAQGRARFLLERPLVARGNDRFVLRSFSPVTTIGGGTVLDPFPPVPGKLRRRRLEAGDGSMERLGTFAREGGLAGVSLVELGVRLGVPRARVTEIIAAPPSDLLVCDSVVVSSAIVQEAAGEVRRRITQYHAENPLDPGMSLQAMRAAIGEAAVGVVPTAVLDRVLDAACRDGSCEVVGAVVRLRSWKPAFDARAEAAKTRLLALVTEAEWRVPTVAELERDLGLGLSPLLAHLVRAGALEQLDQDRYAAPAALQRFRTALQAAIGDKPATPAELRDRLGLSRKFLIPLLEWADRRGITRRQGDARTLVRLTVPNAGS
jgi:selenocysteine-specific elongation factor